MDLPLKLAATAVQIRSGFVAMVGLRLGGAIHQDWEHHRIAMVGTKNCADDNERKVN
jgi:hypothetical protein